MINAPCKIKKIKMGLNDEILDFEGAESHKKSLLREFDP